MICPYCNNFRPANQELCPRCNAPSPLIGGPGDGFSGQLSPTAQENTMPIAPGSAGNINMASPAVPGAETYDNSLWARVMDPQAFPTNSPTNAQQPSLLPVPYQPQQSGIASQSLMTMPPGFPTVQMGGNAALLWLIRSEE